MEVTSKNISEKRMFPARQIVQKYPTLFIHWTGPENLDDARLSKWLQDLRVQSIEVQMMVLSIRYEPENGPVHNNELGVPLYQIIERGEEELLAVYSTKPPQALISDPQHTPSIALASTSCGPVLVHLGLCSSISNLKLYVAVFDNSVDEKPLIKQDQILYLVPEEWVDGFQRQRPSQSGEGSSMDRNGDPNSITNRQQPPRPSQPKERNASLQGSYNGSQRASLYHRHSY